MKGVQIQKNVQKIKHKGLTGVEYLILGVLSDQDKNYSHDNTTFHDGSCIMMEKVVIFHDELSYLSIS